MALSKKVKAVFGKATCGLVKNSLVCLYSRNFKKRIYYEHVKKSHKKQSFNFLQILDFCLQFLQNPIILGLKTGLEKFKYFSSAALGFCEQFQQ